MSLTSIVRTALVPSLVLALSGASALPLRAEGDAPAAKVVNVNQASAAEIGRLPRVGPKLADRIVAHRQQNGPFKRAEALMEVKGIGEKMFATLKPYVVTAGATTLTEKVSSKGTRSPKAAGKGGSRRGKASPGHEPAPSGTGR